MTTPDTKAIRENMKALDGVTPGSWHVNGPKKMEIVGRMHRVLNPEDYPAAFVPAWDQPKPGQVDGTDEAIANARLIAAAPDMRATILALCDALDAAQTSACPRGEDCDMTLAYMVGRGRKDDDMAVLRAENERLRNFIADFSETKFDRIDRRSPDPQDDLDPLTDYMAIEAWQEDARAALAQKGGQP